MESKSFKNRRWLRSIINFIVLYFNNCCVHGFRYLVQTMLVVFEKFLWFVLLFVSIYFCIIVCLSSIDRYYTKSTHIGLERNYHFWNTTLPSLTICPMERLDNTLFADYCRKNGIKGPEKAIFWDFLENLANSTYVNFQNIPQSDQIDQIIKDIGLKPEHYMEVIYNLTVDSTYTPSEVNRTRCVDGQTFIHVRQVLTEYGLCYLGNSRLGEKYSSRYLIFGKYPEFNKYEHERRLIQYLEGSFFEKDVQYTLMGFSSPALDSYIHSAFEVMKVDTNFGYTTDGVVYDPISKEITADDNLERQTTITMRKCRFYHESNLTHFPFYTRNVCMQECRINLAYRICKCIPHFYPNRIANPKPVCDYKTLRSCFPRHASFFLQLYEENGKHEKPETCYCEQNCRDSVVTTRAALPMLGSKQLLGSIGSTVSVKNWPQNRLKRQVIFSMTDLLVSIGGTAGLFLGFSVLGFVEVLYFFTIRLIWQTLGYRL
ncbi:acid-sensing ion channel 5 isoform X3 [Drosophila gunungcola]|uniref:acid-sensing ion channel 5 isoform X3 n=1 Tax=Drosophila gunungcola TaxID=103775 RepID=UPI0022E8CD3C|nr:acid-sensing ion channel 5 isoform X3 [Drosophila gunungcola]